MKLSIVVPCYNEAKNIPLILERFDQAINRSDIEVILVNNGSIDNSEEVFAELIPKYAFARMVKVDINQGYGFGITSGLNAARGEFIGYTHADMQTDPADVLKALDIIEKEADPKNTYVKGDRKGRPVMDQFFTLGMSVFETFYMGKQLWDINAQPNIFHRDFFESLDDTPMDFSLDLYFLFQAQLRKMRVIRFNVVFPPRVHGESSWNTGFASKWKFIKRTLSFSVKLKKQF